MKYRSLGRTGLRVSVVGVGTWQYGGEWGKTYQQEEVTAILGAAAERGVNLIDTAECYGDHLSERLVGGALRDLSQPREQWVLATKFGHHFHKPFERDDRFDAASVQRQLEDSLRALGTDYIDLYQFHSGTDDHFNSDELWEMLRRQVEAGKVRHVGVSISTKRDRYQADHCLERGGEALQVVYNRIDRQPEDNGMFEAAQRDNLGVLARVPLASGFLSGKYDTSSKFDAGDVREAWYADKREAILRAVDEVRGEVPDGVPMAQWALAWCLQHPAVSCVIPGCKNVEQVESNVAGTRLDTVRPDHPQAIE